MEKSLFSIPPKCFVTKINDFNDYALYLYINTFQSMRYNKSSKLISIEFHLHLPSIHDSLLSNKQTHESLCLNRTLVRNSRHLLNNEHYVHHLQTSRDRNAINDTKILETPSFTCKYLHAPHHRVSMKRGTNNGRDIALRWPFLRLESRRNTSRVDA